MLKTFLSDVVEVCHEYMLEARFQLSRLVWDDKAYGFIRGLAVGAGLSLLWRWLPFWVVTILVVATIASERIENR